jgi:beta-glucosidase
MLNSSAARPRARPASAGAFAGLTAWSVAVFLFTVPSSAVAADDIDKRVDALMAQMTLEEKIDLLAGERLFDLDGLPRLNIPAFATADGPFGVRRYSRSTAIPGGIALAATWNVDLVREIGTQLGRDARARGVHFYLAPGVNIQRSPLNGRNFEYFGEDPWLASRVAVNFIEGVQSQGVSATVKHFFGNNSEYARHTTDSIIDERTVREIYLPAFEAAVREAHVGTVMTSYNLVNGEHMAQNAHYTVDLLRKEWGFDGVVMSDWVSTYDALATANSGLDIEMPSGVVFNRKTLIPLIQAGKVKQATLDDKVRHLLRLAARMGWLDRPQADATIPFYNTAGNQVALAAAREAVVLLKNEREVLPIVPGHAARILVIGPNAYPSPLYGGGSATVVPFGNTSLLEGLGNEFAGSGNLLYSRGLTDLRRLAGATQFTTSSDGGERGLKVETFGNLALSGPPQETRVDRAINQGTPLDLTGFATGDADLQIRPSVDLSARWSGYYKPAAAGAHDVFMQVGGFARECGYRLYVDDKLVLDHWTRKMAPLDFAKVELGAQPHKLVFELRTQTGGLDSSVPFVQLGIVREGSWVDPATEALAHNADAVIIAAGFDAKSEAEDWDRTFHLPPGQDELIEKIAAANPRTIVVLTSGGAVDTSRWLAKVPGVLQAWYLGQAGGTALAAVISGKANPSGHLPATFAHRLEDYPSTTSYYPQANSNRAVYEEGVFVGYRGFDRNNVAPDFPFGHGLSYTTFRFSDVQVVKAGDDGAAFNVTVSVTNTGKRAGAVVPQVYVSPGKSAVARPPKELKGFTKVTLQPGETRAVTIPLNARSFAYYDVPRKRWHIDGGEFTVRVGDSAANLPLEAKVVVPGNALAN